jgi:hypothetical protein
MQVLQLYIEGQRVDLFKDESVTVTQTIQNVKDISKVFTDFSKTFNLPASKTNNKIFKHYYNYDIDNGYDARKKTTARLELNNKEFRKGKIKLNSVNLKNGKPHTYKITFFGNTIDLKDLLGEDTLSSLEWLDNFSHEYSATQVRTALGSGIDKTVDSVTYTDAIVAPLITHTTRLFYDSSLAGAGNLYPSGSTMQGVYFEELKYAIPVHIIIKAIEETYGITFSTDFFESTNDPYYKLYMWLHRKKGNAFDEDALVTTLIEGFPADTSPLDVTGLFCNGSNFQVFGMASPVQMSYTFTATQTTSNDYSIIIKKDGQIYRQENVTTTGAYNFTGFFTNSSTGYQIFIYAAGNTNFSGFSLAVTNNLTGESKTYNQTSGLLVSTAQNFIITEQIPKMKVIDFLTGLFKMFNLTAFYEGDTITVKTLDSFYSSSTEIRDITQYVEVTSKDVNVALPFKEVDFGYEGLGTKLALQHQQANNVEWGTVEYKGDDNFDAGGDIYSVKAPFEHLKYERLIDGSTNTLKTVQVGWFVDDNNDPYFGKPLLFYPVSSTPTSIRFLNDTISSFNDISTYFIPSNSVTINSGVDDSNINFNLEVNEYSLDTTFEGTLFEDYYKTYIEEIFNAKLRLTKVKAYLPISFLLNYSLADKVQILDRIYKINSIESNLETGESNLELLNLVNPYVAPVADYSPTVITTSTTSITQTSATINGQVTDAGSPAYTARGFYWAVGSVTPSPLDNFVVVSGTDTNPYSSSITSLSAGTTYSVITWATNSLGTVTGNVITFTTAATQSLASVVTSGSQSITQNSATLLGNITNVGVPNYTSKGFYWMQGSGTPDASDNTLSVSGTSSGSYSGGLTGLSASTTYSFRAFAINSQGTAYGSVLTLTTSATAPTTFIPSVTTNAASSVGTSSVVMNGNVTNVGNPNYTVKGFVYITGSGTPSLSNTITNETVVGTSAGTFNAAVFGLNSSQFYSYRAYATNSVGTAYGATQTFTTQSAATCSGGTLFFQNPVITGINASLGTGQISYSTGQCGNAISPALEFLFTNNEGEWLSESQVTSIQLFEGGTNVSSQYTLDKVLVGDVMNITVGGNFPSASNDGNHTYSIHVTATNVDVYQTDISIPTTVQNASLSVYKDPSYEASKADFEGNNSVLKPRGESGDTYRYLLTYTANSGYEFTGLGNITTPTVSPTGTGVSVTQDSYTSSTYVIEVTGSIQSSDKTASLSYSGSPVAAPATSVSFRYRISPQTSWINVTGAVVVPENVVLQIEVNANGAYYVTLTNSTLTTNVTPSTNNTGATEVHDVTIANNLQGGGDLSGQFRVFPRASSTLLDAVRIDFNDT